MSADQQEQILGSDMPVWCLDPLDGTNNFTSGIPYFSVSLALIVEGRVLLGVVYDPVRDECFAASEEHGSILNGHELKVSATGLQMRQSIAIIDFKRLSGELATRLVNDIPYASQRSYGSVALDWCWMAASRFHVYLHGASNLWDYSAAQLIFSEAGGYSSTLEGEEIYINALSKRSSVGALDKATFDQWYAWLSEHLD